MNIKSDLHSIFFDRLIDFRFWIVISLMNWGGQVMISKVQDPIEGAWANTRFTLTATAFDLLIMGLIY